MRIALAAVLSFAALWFVALRPKPVTDVATEPVPAAKSKPKSTPLTSRPDAARKAVGKLNATSAKREAATGSPAAAAKTSVPTASKPQAAKAAPAPAAKATPAPAAEPAAKAATPAAPKAAKGADAVVADIKAGKSVVLLFWDPRASEDQAVRRAVKAVDHRDGKVRVHVADLRNISRYGAITQGVPVTSSPTVLVIGKDGKAQAIRGLTVTGEIDDAVSSVLRAGK